MLADAVNSLLVLALLSSSFFALRVGYRRLVAAADRQRWTAGVRCAAKIDTRTVAGSRDWIAVHRLLPESVEDAYCYNLLRNAVVIPNMVYSALVLGGLTAVKMIWNLFQRGQLSSEIVDADIFALVTETSFIVFSRLSADGLYLHFDTPVGLSWRSSRGTKIADFHIRFHVPSKSISSASAGDRVLTDRTEILQIICFALVGWLHPMAHVAAERSVQQVLAQQVEGLAPSTRFVLSLHEGLMTHPFSPVVRSDWLGANFTFPDVAEAALQPLPHVLDGRKMQFPVYRFFALGREAIARLVTAYGFSVDVEALFLNTIVHSIDHHGAFRTTGHLVRPWDRDRSLLSYLQTTYFMNVWVRPMPNPFVDERICALARDPAKYPFYADLYKDLAAVDRQLSDLVWVSCSF